MFFEVSRKKQALGVEECIEILRNEKRGVLSVIEENGYPYGMPINHYYNDEDGCIYFHTGRGGRRNASLEKNDRVSLCVFDSGYRREGEWALNIRSVIVFGRIETENDTERALELTRKLSYKFTDDESYIENEIEKFAKGFLVLKLIPEHITGKLVNES